MGAHRPVPGLKVRGGWGQTGLRGGPGPRDCAPPTGRRGTSRSAAGGPVPHLAARGSGVPGGALPTPPRVLTEEPLLRQVRDARPPPSSRGPDADAGVAEHARGAPPAQPQQLPQPGPGRVAVGRHEHRGLRGEQGPPVPARGPVALQAADLQGRGRGGGRQACRLPRGRGRGRQACR